ncbi:uncharacterized protein CTHT_0003900 [Thermochaetoides thermophila DSM 1495]|uniref:von Willebrand domain-containing protein n=1 Tax=Chaetomium thermophilum (strain DSM 1495 / CBS 144.50 / IMI 039719) TaxID=759272 RepID=G0RZR5_CHATD|nr:hypothetical protein CTHT_0003900 [Thermochaetoides thermophila DSM 1495]EGS23693.1 hypothetical protein CTHT_0003900 [Thermochaetoides thermophila DSM 1495]
MTKFTIHGHVCGLYYALPAPNPWHTPLREYLPQLSLSTYTKIVSYTSRTTLTQIFANPKDQAIPELRYTFPLYEGVSVIGFVCTINDDRVIRGVVKERSEANAVYTAAVKRGETAGLLEQLPSASDVFTTTIGNVPAKATIKVVITYLGELKHDGEVDGIRFTIPTAIAPRYGSYPGQVLNAHFFNDKAGISIVVDVEMPNGSNIKNIQSPSHPISVTVGNTSVGVASGSEMSLQKASATLSLAKSELGDDFVLQIVATNSGYPVAVLETHPTIPNHQALMATIVPKFSLPPEKPEIVFVCDRSGSMATMIPALQSAVHIFLKSLPVGVKFNICSFGSHYEFLFEKGSRTYDASTVAEAVRYVDSFQANFGGTEMYQPLEQTFKKRLPGINLEVFLLTDGEIWKQSELIDMINRYVSESNGAVRVFTLGIGSTVSHALVEGVAAAGNGFSQTVGDNENMNSKVVRMLKASLTPHVNDYTMELKYHTESQSEVDIDSDFEVIEKVMDALAIEVEDPSQKQQKQAAPKNPISLFDPSADPDVERTDASLDQSAGGKFSHIPAVSEPKILQAPFRIPPLFPYSRTSIYLLISPGAIDRRLKSIILRGTCSHGPLELEVPVTVLEDKGETIHQLAARKAVKELENGCGWLYHAKDFKDGGKLLKEKYPAHFDDMVEREAVRLGVTYQVGGKWCSFVAVETNGVAYVTPEGGSTSHTLPSHMLGRNYSFSGTGGSIYHLSMPVHDKSDSDEEAAEVETWGPSWMPASPPPPPAPAPMSGPFSKTVRTANANMNLLSRDGGSLFSHPPPPSSPSVPLVTSNAVFSQQSQLMAGHGMTAPTGPRGFPVLSSRRALKATQRRAMPSIPSGLALSRCTPPEREVNTPTSRVSSDVLFTLVKKQDFSGFWCWSDEVLGILRLDSRQKKDATAKLGGKTSSAATALVLAFLRVKLADRQDEWEMVDEKARSWLESQPEVISLGGLEVFLEKAKEIMLHL